MRLSFSRFLLIGLGLFIGTIPVLAGEQSCNKGNTEQVVIESCSKMASELLAGVVHLSDDDIRFRTKSGINVFVDPVNGPDNELVVACGVTKPDLILITHSHADHFQPAVIQEYLKLNPKAVLAGPLDVTKTAREKGIKNVKVVRPNQNYSIADVNFLTVPSYFTEGDSHPKVMHWVGYVLQLDGARYYVTGDTQPLPEMEKVNADVVFPLLFGCGGNVDQAVKMTELCKARIAVPVHHSNQEEAIKKYIAKLPKGIQNAYYQDGKLTTISNAK